MSHPESNPMIPTGLFKNLAIPTSPGPLSSIIKNGIAFMVFSWYKVFLMGVHEQKRGGFSKENKLCLNSIS